MKCEFFKTAPFIDPVAGTSFADFSWEVSGKFSGGAT
jgi:hypothetical protein